MPSGDGDSLKLAESVQRFLRDVLDQVVSGTAENKTEERRNLVHHVLDDVIRETVQIAEEKVSDEKDDSVTGIIQDENRQIKTTSGGNEPTSSNITNSFLTHDNISDVSAITDRLESLSKKYGQQQSQNIKSLQSEYIESVAYEKTDAKNRVRADELKGKVSTPISKLKKKKTRYAKVKIYHTGELSADEQKRIVKEATELMKYLKENEMEEKRRKRAAKEKKGIGARVLGFFRSLSCCKASTDA